MYVNYRQVCSSRQVRGPVGREAEDCSCPSHPRPPAPQDRWMSGCSLVCGPAGPHHGDQLSTLCQLDIFKSDNFHLELWIFYWSANL